MRIEAAQARGRDESARKGKRPNKLFPIWLQSLIAFGSENQVGSLTALLPAMGSCSRACWASDLTEAIPLAVVPGIPLPGRDGGREDQTSDRRLPSAVAG